MSYQELLAERKKRGIKPPCRGRNKATVIEELQEIPDRAPTIVDKSKLKLAGKPHFSLGNMTNDAIEVRDWRAGKVALFFRKGNALDKRDPLEQPFEKYAQVCVDALNDFFGDE